MSGVNHIVSNLRRLFEEDIRMRERLKEANRDLENPSFVPDFADFQRQQIIAWEGKISIYIESIFWFPPQHSRHLDKLAMFHGCPQYEEQYKRSIFIMTKFPEGESAEDRALLKVINAVANAIDGCAHIPKIASESDYHPLLWDNVELYLLGCFRGVAIVEDRYRPELNPNVAMEWGWMRGMGKEVLFLVESEFEHFRADLSGAISYPFVWEDPEPGVRDAVTKWLNGSKLGTER